MGFAVRRQDDQTGMPAGNHRRQHGIQTGIVELVWSFLTHERTVDVTEKMIDPDQRQVIGNGESFGECHTDQERGNKTGRMGHGDRRKIGRGDPRILQRLIHHGTDRSKMFTGSQFRNHTAVRRVLCDLGCHHI